MYSNFIPKIGKYYSLKENAMFTRIKLGAWTMICICSIFIITGLASNESFVEVPVRPSFDNLKLDTVLANYGQHNIKLTGVLQVNNATWKQKILFPDQLLEFDLFNCLLVICISILLLKLLPHIHSKTVLQSDISSLIRWMGITLIGFWILDMLRIFLFTVPEISKLTNNEFIYQKNGFMFFPVPFWLGIAILWVSRLYKNAFAVKQEQELTI